jgi:hypothetical protein
MREEISKNWSQAEKAGNQICSMRWIMHMVFLVNYAVDRNVSIRWPSHEEGCRGFGLKGGMVEKRPTAGNGGGGGGGGARWRCEAAAAVTPTIEIRVSWLSGAGGGDELR